MAIADIGDREQQAEISQRQAEYDVAESHFRKLAHRLRTESTGRRTGTTNV
jgi:hypothetical protein